MGWWSALGGWQHDAQRAPPPHSLSVTVFTVSRPLTRKAAAPAAATAPMASVALAPPSVLSAELPATYTRGSTANTLVWPAESDSVKPRAYARGSRGRGDQEAAGQGGRQGKTGAGALDRARDCAPRTARLLLSKLSVGPSSSAVALTTHATRRSRGPVVLRAAPKGAAAGRACSEGGEDAGHRHRPFARWPCPPPQSAMRLYGRARPQRTSEPAMHAVDAIGSAGALGTGHGGQATAVSGCALVRMGKRRGAGGSGALMAGELRPAQQPAPARVAIRRIAPVLHRVAKLQSGTRDRSSMQRAARSAAVAPSVGPRSRHVHTHRAPFRAQQQQQQKQQRAGRARLTQRRSAQASAAPVAAEDAVVEAVLFDMDGVLCNSETISRE